MGAQVQPRATVVVVFNATTWFLAVRERASWEVEGDGDDGDGEDDEAIDGEEPRRGT